MPAGVKRGTTLLYGKGKKQKKGGRGRLWSSKARVNLEKRKKRAVRAAAMRRKVWETEKSERGGTKGAVARYIHAGGLRNDDKKEGRDSVEPTMPEHRGTREKKGNQKTLQ